MTPTTVRTVGRRFLDLMNPDPDQIVMSDIAWSLSRVARWNGHTLPDPIYSVATHSLFVAQRVQREFMREALMHDAHEAYIGDITRPVALCLDSEAVAALKRRLDAAISKRFNLRLLDKEAMTVIKVADDEAMKLEEEQLFSVVNRKAIPQRDRCERHTISEAHDLFLAVCRENGIS